MKKNGFTLPFTLFIFLITSLIITSTLFIYSQQLHFEKSIQSYYQAEIEARLVLMQKTTASEMYYGSSKIQFSNYNSINATITANIWLKNGYHLQREFFLPATKESGA
ncbi:competence protein ComG [Listeria sp. PSOL-1]|uniref:competence protein ComG n=1 Tax=Listeria sp. PSOL-1 TaxID=1844999 RepID=UPI0013D4D135|nr:competence protein ComG [Listeria sp. PSOL-1]